MSKLLEQVVDILRKRPQSEQDEAAEILVEFLFGKPVNLDDLDLETRAAVEEGLAQAERGEFASEEEMEALFARFR